MDHRNDVVELGRGASGTRVQRIGKVLARPDLRSEKLRTVELSVDSR
jgi:hypothetical protein